ncbi:siroheme synthase / Precorrin-2 oxidase /sirohydrochlorin ferrochelatase [Vibrio ponticus]|nr:siroheme synthase / Precorrin-2 oxidase /sirohydrochlorin ferrochelatase [Vibrio ponticus]
MEHATQRSELEQCYQRLLSDNVTENGQVTWLEFGDDIELLSLKALRLMQQAELVLHPHNCPFVFIDSVRRDAERVAYQDEGQLSELLARAKEQHLRVVVFIEKGSARYDLLIGADLRLAPAE